MKIGLFLLSSGFGLVALCPAQTTLFSDNFDGGTSDLNGSTPDTGSVNWVATATNFLADGTIGGTGAGSATLAFTPFNGLVYTLDASFSGIAGNNDWIPFGFVNGQGTSSSSSGTSENRFLEHQTAGIAWMFARGDNTTYPNRAFLGDRSVNTGNLSGSDWSGGPTNGGEIDMRIVLDTSGGSGTWTATWFAKRPADSSYTEIRATTTLVSEAITSVGFGKANSGVSGTIESFSLSYTGELPPPPPPPTPTPDVSFIPVTDGDPTTDENGFAGYMNAVAFIQDNLVTVGGQQFIAYYRRHATDASHPDNDTVLIARRNIDESHWEVFTTKLKSYDINDPHNTISFAIDGDGVLHMSWGMHGIHDPGPMLYAKSTGSVLGDIPITMTSLGPAGMTGQENTVTYPIFLTLPDGDLLFLFREGAAGRADWYLNRYDTGTDQWSPLHATAGGAHLPFMKGTGDSPPNCFYADRMTLGPDGVLHLSGPFRYRTENSPAGENGMQTNHRYVYLRSPDYGVSWQRSDGCAIDLPAVEKTGFAGHGASHVPEIVEDFPEGYSIINQSGMTTDSAGRPIIANWWADDAGSGDHTRQYHIFFHDGSLWHKRTLSARDIDDPAVKYAARGGGDLRRSRMSRPVVLTDADDRIIVVYNDNRFDGISVVFSLPLAMDPERIHWTRMNLTHENLGLWEATYDEHRWQQDGVLQMLYQKNHNPAIGLDYSAQNTSTPVSVVEWDANAYFNSPIRWDVDMTSIPGQAAVSAFTRSGFRYDLKTSTDLDFSAPPAATVTGDGNGWDFGTWPADETRRFWRLERVEEASGGL